MSTAWARAKMASRWLLSLLLSLLLSAAALIPAAQAAVSCLDMNNRSVDWFIVYKLPEHSGQSPQAQAGYGQMYMDVNNPVLELSDVWLRDSNHAIAYTLQQIYRNADSQELAFLMYNDQLPDSKSKTEYYGHTKGDLAFDTTSGFWLVHSTPRFPSNASMRYSWPESARIYGQSFLCVTYGYDQFEEIGKQLMYNHPWVYDSHLPAGVVGGTPSIVAAANKRHVESPPWNRRVALRSKGGQQFLSFAKSSNFAQDLYAAWLAPYFGCDLYTETWQNGPADRNLNSSCSSGPAVSNIKSLRLAGGAVFPESKDHSKWAVTNQSGMTWTCIGDINRQCHQMVRGGGTVCFENAAVHQTYWGAVTSIQRCPQVTSCDSHHARTSVEEDRFV